MSFVAFHNLLDIQPVSNIASPQPAHQKQPSKTPQTFRNLDVVENVELDPIPPGKNHSFHYDGRNPIETTTDANPTQTPNELEMSRPSTPRQDGTFGLMRTWNSPPMTKWRILCCCLIYFSNGTNDSVIGALIPYMEASYHISYSVISLIFISNALGFIVAAFFTNTVLGKFGRAKTLALSEIIQVSANIILVCAPPYPVVVTSFFLLGYGAAINLALNNVYCAHTHPPSVILGLVHGSYGVGGIIAPIIGTAIVSQGIKWSRFYFLMIGLRICGVAFSASAFWAYKEDSEDSLLTTLEVSTSRQSAAEEAASKMKDLKVALKSKVTIFGALFIFAYQGAEVSISGWLISYLIHYRDGDPSKVGYVTAGFWAGITLGRFILTHAAGRIGEKRFIVILTLGTFVLQLLTWLTPNLIGNAVAVSLLGFLLGPVYPCAQTIFSRLLPRRIQTNAVGFIAGAGSSGGALAPFTTGILAQAAGTWVLHPVCIGLYAAMLACWFALPRVHKRKE